jgi:hypothetical protein
MKRKFALLTILPLFAGLAGAAPISTLFNTGLNGFGGLLTGGNGDTDFHYVIRSGPPGGTDVGYPIGTVAYFNVAYLADGPNSRWISSTGTGGLSAGTYDFQTTFNLTGFNPASTTITVSCATDNLLDHFQVNGITVAGDCDGFSSFGAPFVVNTNFVAGLNKLDFFMVDLSLPMAFRAEFTSNTAPLSGVPEPATVLLSSTGLALLALHRFRSSRNKA